ncbi:MAG: hypothetical protein ABIR67_11460 [Gaiellaceae bacterium]
MSKMIQIRNVPEPLHRLLKANAAKRGLSLSGYLLQMAEREAGRVPFRELSERIERRGRVNIGPTAAADAVRALRGPID